METSKNTITIPGYWTQPKYSLGQRIKQGIIVGIQYYQSQNLLTDYSNGSWRYAVLDNGDFEEIIHLSEQKIQPLSSQELTKQIQDEIELYQNSITVLSKELSAID